MTESSSPAPAARSAATRRACVTRSGDDVVGGRPRRARRHRPRRGAAGACSTRDPTSSCTPRRGRRSTPASRDPDRAIAVNASAPATSPRAPARSAPTSCYLSTDYVFDGTKPDAVRRVGRRRTRRRCTAGRSWAGEQRASAAATTRSCASRGCAARTATTWSRPAAPGRGRRDSRRSSTTRSATRRSSATSCRCCAGSRSSAARAVPRDQPGRGVVVRVRAGDLRGRRAPTRAGARRSRPPSSIRRARRPGRPTRCSTTPRCASRASRCCPTSASRCTGWSRNCRATHTHASSAGGRAEPRRTRPLSRDCARAGWILIRAVAGAALIITASFVPLAKTAKPKSRTRAS